jgi:hypothetical protein
MRDFNIDTNKIMSMLNSQIPDPTGTSAANYFKEEQFNRENNLNRGTAWRCPRIAAVIGLGGIGSHVVDILTSMSELKMIILFDGDIIEASNLGRTTYRMDHIGSYKVEAVAEMISSRNPSVSIVPMASMFNEDTANEMSELVHQSFLANDILSRLIREPLYVYDCRDDDYRDYNHLDKFVKNVLRSRYFVFRPAYNGMSMTMDARPDLHPVWGNRGYSVIPSHGIPSRMIALLTVTYSCVMSKHRDYTLKTPYTFNVEDVIDYIVMGNTIDKMQSSGNAEEKELAYKIIDAVSKKLDNDVNTYDTKNTVKVEDDDSSDNRSESNSNTRENVPF